MLLNVTKTDSQIQSIFAAMHAALISSYSRASLIRCNAENHLLLIAAMLQNVQKVTEMWYINISLVIYLTFFLMFDSSSSDSKPLMKDQTRQTIKMIYQRPSKQRYQLFYVSFYNEDRIIVATSQSLILKVCSDVLKSLTLYQARRSNFARLYSATL